MVTWTCLMESRWNYVRNMTGDILCKAENLRKERVFLETRLRALVTAVESDITFLTHGLTAAEQEYEKQFNAPNTSKELLKTLYWERVEFNTLLQQPQSFSGRCAECFDRSLHVMSFNIFVTYSSMSYCCRYETMISSRPSCSTSGRSSYSTV